MNKGKQKTQRQLQETLSEMRRLICMGHTVSEIMDKLNIHRRTCYFYKKKLNEELSHVFMKKEIEDLALEADILKDRLTRMFKAIQDRLNDPKTNTKDMPNLVQAGQELAIYLFKIESESARTIDYRRLQTIQKQNQKMAKEADSSQIIRVFGESR